MCPTVLKFGEMLTALMITHKAGYRESTNQQFIASYTIKFPDIVYLKTLELIFQVVIRNLPICIHFLFFFRLREPM